MKEDNKKKFEEIYGEESDAIFRFCLSRVSNREQALDITQETFLRLWQSISDQKDIRNSKAFLFTVAHRLIIDWYRKKKSISLESIMYREGEMEYDPVDEKTREGLGFRLEARHLLDKVDQLSPTSRDPIYLSFVEGLSPPEIGEILGISANATSVRLSRGLEELRKITGYNTNKKQENN